MKKIIDIYHSFLTSKNQLVLAGTNDFNDFTSNELRKLENGSAVLKRPGLEDIIIHILNIESASSIIGKKNIFVLISERFLPSDIPVGSKIYLDNVICK